jgi:pimeloyl-ACP methyl ester carboxylesterase
MFQLVEFWDAIEPETVNEYLRTFSGREGVLGAMGVYRAAFINMEQTAPLVGHKVHLPVVALGGEKGLGAKVGEMIKMVAKNVDNSVLKDCGHFFSEERPDEIVRHVRQLTTTRKHTDWRNQ